MRLISHIVFLSSNIGKLNNSIRLCRFSVLRLALLLAGGGLFTGVVLAADTAEKIPIMDTHFTPSEIFNWEAKVFEGATEYRLVLEDGEQVLRANSQGTASGLFYETEIDLNKTPYLSWRWKITQLPMLDNELKKNGDDFAARIYIVVNDGWTFLSTQAISYVWSAKVPEGQQWPNPFTGKSAVMVSVRQQAAGDTWYTEKRNLKADLKQLFGKDITMVKAIAVMTDTDNSKSRAEAFYGNLSFSAQ